MWWAFKFARCQWTWNLKAKPQAEQLRQSASDSNSKSPAAAQVPWYRQQVHARNQGSHCSAEYPPPARHGWRWRGRSRWSAWRLAPPTRPIPPRRRCHDIGCDITKSMISYGYDILSYWYQRCLISWVTDITSKIIRNVYDIVGNTLWK
jgi:hypothetical protein